MLLNLLVALGCMSLGLAGGLLLAWLEAYILRPGEVLLMPHPSARRQCLAGGLYPATVRLGPPVTLQHADPDCTGEWLPPGGAGLILCTRCSAWCEATPTAMAEAERENHIGRLMARAAKGVR